MYSPRDLLLARRAKRAGASYSLRIILEARRAKLPISLAFAVVHHESSFQNIFGCDKQHGKEHPLCHQAVTPARVKYLLRFAQEAGGWSNGVGLTQLTSLGLIYQAEHLGGADSPRNQLRVGFQLLSGLVHTYGEAEGLAAYNAGPGGRFTPIGRKYAHDVLNLQAHYHEALK